MKYEQYSCNCYTVDVSAPVIIMQSWSNDDASFFVTYTVKFKMKEIDNIGIQSEKDYAEICDVLEDVRYCVERHTDLDTDVSFYCLEFHSNLFRKSVISIAK